MIRHVREGDRQNRIVMGGGGDANYTIGLKIKAPQEALSRSDLESQLSERFRRHFLHFFRVLLSGDYVSSYDGKNTEVKCFLKVFPEV
jgi:hypothetical protein